MDHRSPGADAAMTGAMNAFGQDGSFKATQLPIKNRINALDVSERSMITNFASIFSIRETLRMPSSFSMITRRRFNCSEVSALL